MARSIVAIGGGENGRKLKDGTYATYETGPMDEEIIKLTGKKHPNFLFIAHSQLQSLDAQDFYFQTMKNVYGGRYNCECKMLRSDKLTDTEFVQDLVDWADIIYEGGGNTLDMIELWKNTGFDKILKKHGKVEKYYVVSQQVLIVGLKNAQVIH
jgi:dipeptidase E